MSPSSALEHSSPKWDCSQSPPGTRWNALALPFLQESRALPPPPFCVLPQGLPHSIRASASTSYSEGSQSVLSPATPPDRRSDHFPEEWPRRERSVLCGNGEDPPDPSPPPPQVPHPWALGGLLCCVALSHPFFHGPLRVRSGPNLLPRERLAVWSLGAFPPPQPFFTGK